MGKSGAPAGNTIVGPIGSAARKRLQDVGEYVIAVGALEVMDARAVPALSAIVVAGLRLKEGRRQNAAGTPTRPTYTPGMVSVVDMAVNFVKEWAYLVWQVSLRIVNLFVLNDGNELTVIDTGTPGSEGRLRASATVLRSSAAPPPGFKSCGAGRRTPDRSRKVFLVTPTCA